VSTRSGEEAARFPPLSWGAALPLFRKRTLSKNRLTPQGKAAYHFYKGGPAGGRRPADGRVEQGK